MSVATGPSELMGARASATASTTIASLLGRATETPGRLFAAAAASASGQTPQDSYLSHLPTSAPALSLAPQYLTTQNSMMDGILTTAISTATTTPPPTTTIAALTTIAAGGASAVSAHLQQQQSPVATASLYSLEELGGHWSATASNYAALIHALLASFSVILVSELGDKTFIITAIMAMKNSRSLVFVASALALFLMTVLSVGMGVAVTVIPEVYTHYASIVLFLCFGLKMLKESYDMSAAAAAGSESEFDEVKRSLEKEDLGADDELSPRHKDKNNNNNENDNSDDENTDADAAALVGVRPSKAGAPNADVAAATAAPHPSANLCASLCCRLKRALYVAPIVIKVFTMVFVAEWGDRSQISTVILAAREDVFGVFVGSLSGHVFCTGLAVIGGRFVADMISVRTMTLLGGIIFLFFAMFELMIGPEPQA